MIPEIRIEDYNYGLPEEKIARYPLPERDASKLLVYKDGGIRDRVFRSLAEELPSDSIMVFNDTKVVPARLFFRRPTGARIEIFCLEPDTPAEYNLNFASDSCCRWKCVMGNAKRWKDDILTVDDGGHHALSVVELSARLVSREGQTGTVEFSWKGGLPFSKVLELCGQVPIPPYLNRDTESIDLERYQTLYAKIKGSVAAPTAGLHFTERVLEDIRNKGISIENVCLHVGAGTFLPVKSTLISGHPMHREPFSVSVELIKKLADDGRKLIAVGTTSVRTLESLYYEGVAILENGRPAEVQQWAPYDREYKYSRGEAFGAIVRYLEERGLDSIVSGTRIIIVPGFKFRVTDILVTNFHQPQSTLLLLISAFVNGDWRKIYDHALSENYRFLSYGDSSLLFRTL